MLRVRSSGLRAISLQLLRPQSASQAALNALPTSTEAQPPQPSGGSFWGSLGCRDFVSPAQFKAAVSNAHPQALTHDTDTGELPDDASIGGWKHYLLQLGGFYSRESALIRGSKGLYKTVVEQAEDPALKEGLGLPDRFASTHALLCLHMWMLLVRLRDEGQDGKDLAQILYEGFQDDVEIRVHAAGVKVRISKHLKELEKMFYGACESYEKSLKGQEDLTDALLRNVYGNDEAQRPHAVALTQYVRRELACLTITPGDAVMRGKIQFSQLS